MNRPTYEEPYFTEEHRMIADQIRQFVEKEVMPFGEEWEEAEQVPREPLRKLGELGLLGMRHPEEYGGSNLDALSSVVLAEQLGYSTFGGFTATVTVHTDMASPHLTRYGTDEQKQKYLPSIITGETVTAIAVTEPDAGSDVASMRTIARRDGNHYILNGSKMFITNGVYGDLVFVAARTDPDAKGSQGISMFIVEKGTPGFSVGRKLKKTGWWCSDTAELVFEDCRLAADCLLGAENKGFYSIMDNFQNERLIIGAICLGEASKALELTLDHVRQRQAFSGTLWDQQAIRQRVSMLCSKLEAGRQLVYHTASLDAKGVDCIREVSMVKAFCAELLNEVMYDCVQFHGGMGYMRETAVERMSRDARVLAIGGGATEVMLEEVAKRI